MKTNHKVILGAIIGFLLFFTIAYFVQATPLPTTPFIPLNRNGEEGFWMNLETAKEVAWAMSMIPVYEDGLEEAEKAASKLDDALDIAIGINIERDSKIENLERWRVGLLVANLFQAIMNVAGVMIW